MGTVKMSAQGVKGILRISLSSNTKNNVTPLTQILIPQQAFLSTSNVSSSLVKNVPDAKEAPKVEPRRKSKMATSNSVGFTNLKQGSGYRSSFSGKVATVFGGTSMVGRGVTNRLGKTGTQMIIPYRGSGGGGTCKYRDIKCSGDLGQVVFVPFDLRDEEAIKRAMKYSDIVINLIGREFETRNFKFEDVNVKGPALIAKCAREMGVDRLIHISSINARENPEKLLWYKREPSKWLRTKWEGEQAVLKEFPDATIFRACEMYGYGDHFVSYYNSRMRKSVFNRAVMPLWNKGRSTIKYPLFFSDLVSGIMAALDDPASKGMTFDARGPEALIMAELMDWMHDVMDKTNMKEGILTRSDLGGYGYRRAELWTCPGMIMNSWMIENVFPFGQKFLRGNTLERLDRSQLSETSEGYPGLETLGVKLHTVEHKMPEELKVWTELLYHQYRHKFDRPPIRPLRPLSRAEEREYRKEIANGNAYTRGLLGKNPIQTQLN